MFEKAPLKLISTGLRRYLPSLRQEVVRIPAPMDCWGIRIFFSGDESTYMGIRNREWHTQDGEPGEIMSPLVSQLGVHANSGVQLVSATVASMVATHHRPTLFPLSTDYGWSRGEPDQEARTLFDESVRFLSELAAGRIAFTDKADATARVMLATLSEEIERSGAEQEAELRSAAARAASEAAAARTATTDRAAEVREAAARLAQEQAVADRKAVEREAAKRAAPAPAAPTPAAQSSPPPPAPTVASAVSTPQDRMRRAALARTEQGDSLADLYMRIVTELPDIACEIVDINPEHSGFPPAEGVVIDIAWHWTTRDEAPWDDAISITTAPWEDRSFWADVGEDIPITIAPDRSQDEPAGAEEEPDEYDGDAMWAFLLGDAERYEYATLDTLMVVLAERAIDWADDEKHPEARGSAVAYLRRIAESETDSPARSLAQRSRYVRAGA